MGNSTGMSVQHCILQHLFYSKKNERDCIVRCWIHIQVTFGAERWSPRHLP